MWKRLPLGRAVLVGLIVGLSAWLVLSFRSHEPIYQGKSVTFWIQSLTNNLPQREQAEKALGEIGIPAMPYLVAAFEKPEGFWAKRYSYLREAAPAVTRKFLPEPFPWETIRTAIAQVLGWTGSAYRWSDGLGEAPSTPQIERAVRALARGLADPSPGVRTFSAQALAFFGPNARNAVPSLLKMFKAGDAQEKIMVCQAFGTIGPCRHGPEAVQAMLRALDDSEKRLNIAAVAALGGMGLEAEVTIPALIERLTASEENMRRTSLRTLARFRSLPSKIRPQLLQFLNETNESMRAGAAVALLRIDPHDTQAFDVVIDCLNPTKPANSRSGTLYLMMGTGPPQILLPKLRNLATDSDPNVSAFARVALKRASEAETKAAKAIDR